MSSHIDYIRQPKVDGVRLVDNSHRGKAVIGTLHLTTTHIIFVDPKGSKETWILYSHIDSAERLPLTTGGSPLQIKTKRFRNITFIIAREKACSDVFATISHLSRPTNIEDLYAFHYNPKEEKLPRAAGWFLYDPASEFNRMEVTSEHWVMSRANINYQLCETYPSLLYVPKTATPEMIQGSAQFRSKNRLPALSYYHRKTMSAICRCAQPLAGFNSRCTEDENYLQTIIASNPNSTEVYIIDTRPKINAMANRAQGKGYENVDHYDNVRFHFIGIENIHVMRQSLQKMLEIFDAKHVSTTHLLKGLEECAWLKHIKSVMETSAFIARAIDQESCSALVHCSDGWDRTSQTCALAEILLDPYYRTIHGFQVLVEKEWLSFGHKFLDRCGFLDGDSKEVSPIFTQFLESIWHLMNQFPTAFQFNERYLLQIHDHLYSCQFGTFLGNCERQRLDFNLPQRTYSLWGYVWQNISDYINPFYQDAGHKVLQPSTALHQFKFWRSLYCRFSHNIHPRELIADHVSMLNDHNDSLKDHIRYLEKITAAYKEELAMESSESTVADQIDSVDAGNYVVVDNAGNDESLSSVETDIKSTEQTDGVDDTHAQIISEEMEALSINEDVRKPRSNAVVDDFGSGMKKFNSMPDLSQDVSTFAVNWDSVRYVIKCSCLSPIDLLSRKYNCWNCGKVFCLRCVDKQSVIPGHYSENQVRVCKPCFRTIRRS